jgi:DNA polymerase III alpha subunit
MICANFTGGEAEELRRALGHKRSRQKMLDIETRLRSGMTQNGVAPKARMTSFSSSVHSRYTVSLNRIQPALL